MGNAITVVGVIIGIVFSWLITRWYYLKSLDIQRKEFINTEKEYRRIVEKFVDKQNTNGEISKKLLQEKRLEQCVEKYTHTGGGEFLVTLIETYTDLSNKEKADLLDAALLRARGRKAKENPFRKRDDKSA
jgi:hypothetical protein